MAFASILPKITAQNIQKRMLEEQLLEWKGKNEQTDDITVFGIKI